jgi:hypothetical protein
MSPFAVPVPAKMCPFEFIAKDRITQFVKPVCVHVLPLSVERCTPPNKPPAKICLLALQTREEVWKLVKPLLSSVHVSPLFVERYTPAPYVPAKRCPLELMASDRTYRFVKLLLICVQVSPLFVERYTPPLNVPAKICPLELRVRA